MDNTAALYAGETPGPSRLERTARREKKEPVGADSCLLPEDVLLFRVYPGLQQVSPLVTVEEILAELEDSLGEVVKFLDEAVLDLVSKIRGLYERYAWK